MRETMEKYKGISKPLMVSIYLFQTSHLLFHKKLGKCASLHPQNNQLLLLPCDPVNNYQKWNFKQITPKW